MDIPCGCFLLMMAAVVIILILYCLSYPVFSAFLTGTTPTTPSEIPNHLHLNEAELHWLGPWCASSSFCHEVPCTGHRYMISAWDMARLVAAVFCHAYCCLKYLPGHPFSGIRSAGSCNAVSSSTLLNECWAIAWQMFLQSKAWKSLGHDDSHVWKAYALYLQAEQTQRESDVQDGRYAQGCWAYW